jgi:hypothetical protein
MSPFKNQYDPRTDGFPINRLSLKRYLSRNVGRSWNDIYRELCEKFTSKKERYALGEMLSYLVEHNVSFDEKTQNYIDTKGAPLFWGSFFVVHGGILREINHGKRYRQWPPEIKRAHKGMVWVDKKICAKIEGIWYELILLQRQPFYHKEPIKSPHLCYDLFFDDYISDEKRQIYYGDKNLYCGGKRQLRKSVIKKLQLNELLEKYMEKIK